MIQLQRSSLPPDPAGAGLQPAGDGKMWFDRRFQSRLQQAGLVGLDAVMVSSTGRCLRVLKDRENWHLELRDGQREPRRVYVKKHHVRTWQGRIRAKLGAGPGETAGRAEARNVQALVAQGIGVMKVIAYGEGLRGDGLVESFVLTEELSGYAPLDDFMRGRFAPCQARGGVRSDRDLDRLILQVAGIVRRFHAAGYNHRDLYGCHLFVREPVRGEFEIKLIDLQRMQFRRRFRRRWLIKDLAQLAWSVPRDRVRCTQRLAFMRHYLGVRKLRPADKRLIRAVLAKQRVMQRKLGVAP